VLLEIVLCIKTKVTDNVQILHFKAIVEKNPIAIQCNDFLIQNAFK